MLKPKVNLHIFPTFLEMNSTFSQFWWVKLVKFTFSPGPACAAVRGLRRAGGVAEAAEVSRDGGASGLQRFCGRSSKQVFTLW